LALQLASIIVYGSWSTTIETGGWNIKELKRQKTSSVGLKKNGAQHAGGNDIRKLIKVINHALHVERMFTHKE